MEFEFVKCYSVSEDEVFKFFYDWVIAERMGECIKREDMVAKSAAQVASENTDAFVRFLENH